MNFESGQRKRGKDSCLLTIVSCVSPGSPTEDDVPARQYATGGGRWTASTVSAYVCPRFTPQCLITGTSMPYSTIRNVCLFSSSRYAAVLPAYNRGRVPITNPTTPSPTLLHIYVSVLPVLHKYWYMPENSQIFHFRIFMGKETFTFLQLGSNRLFPSGNSPGWKSGYYNTYTCPIPSSHPD